MGDVGQKDAAAGATGTVGEVFRAFLRLGLTAFGGPVAHLGYFREEFVARRAWLDDEAYADLVALCQFLPGPASSQVGMALGLMRAGRRGALAAWVGFTLPSAIALTLFALGLARFGTGAAGGLHGLKIAAAAVVAVALLGMIRSLAATRETATIAVVGLGVATIFPGIGGQSAAIALGAVAGSVWPGRGPVADGTTEGGGLATPIGRVEALAMLAIFAAVSLVLPLWATGGSGTIGLIDAFWRAGSWVFGGGHVVLPLLQADMVTTGRVDGAAFLAGYGATQAVPGPLFTFAAFLGAVATIGPGGILGAAMALVAIFLPSWFLVGGVLPFWSRLRTRVGMRAVLTGVNAAVVGLLAAAFFEVVWPQAIGGPGDVVLAAAAFVALVAWRAPPWAVVAVCAVSGLVLAAA